MNIKFTYEKEFTELMKKLQNHYPNQIKEIEGIGEDLDINKFAEKFFKSNVTTDVSIDDNANVTDNSVISYRIESKKPIAKLNSYYMLWKELENQFGLQEANEIIERQYRGDIYINDFHGVGGALPYCFNYSTYDIMLQGLPMVNKIRSKPPKHLYSFKSQVEQFTVIASNSTLGATGLADLLIVMSMYIDEILETKQDASFKFQTKEDIWSYVEETLSSLIYTVNQPMRTGLQSPFTNVSIYDDYFLNNMIEDYVHPITGETPNKSTIKKLQEVYLDVMNKELERTPVTFPVTTACFSVDDNNNIQDKEFLDFISEKNLKYGFINVYIGKSSTLSSCCRLRSSNDNEYMNTFGAGSSKIGSLGVVTINLPRVAFKHKKGDVNWYEEIEVLVETCNKINYAKRCIIKDKIERGHHPLYSLGFIDINNQYQTVGINGFYEFVDILDKDMLGEGKDLGLDLINKINNENSKWSKAFEMPTNCEQIPGESTSVKLANKDKLLGYNKEYNIYSNQFIPLTDKADLLDRIYLQGQFDGKFSGGSICHLNVETKIEDVEKMKELIEMSANKGVVYFAINYNLQECGEGHMSVGREDMCGVCGDEIINNYTRVVGFLTNTKNWNKTRREIDYPNREFYKGLYV